MIDMVKYNGRSSDDPAFGIKSVVVVQRQLLAGTKDRRIETPGKDGIWDMGYDLDALMIWVRFYLSAVTIQELRDNIRSIAEWLSPRQVKPLIFADEPDKQYYARRTGEILPTGEERRRFIDVYFLAPDPHAYSLTTKTASPNAGTAPTPVRITATMIGAATHLQVNLGDQFIRINHPLGIGDVVLIDTQQRYVAINGLDAMKHVTFDSSWLLLPVGAFTLTADNATLAILYRERWL